ncbi:MAG: MFS transporter, partial [Chromatocurvus sp.]
MSIDDTAIASSTPAQTVDTVSKPIKVAWGAGALGVSVLMNSVSFLVMFYMVGVLHIEPALAGTLIFATKLLDVVSDPVVGIWSDRISSRIGRRRPFLIPGAILSAIALALIFTTPVFETQAFTATYIFCALLIYTIGYTVFNVPYMAMPAEMTDSYHERSSIHAYRVVFVTMGSFLASSVAPWTLETLGKTEWSSYATLGVCGAIIVFASMFVSFLGTGRARHLPSGAAIPDIRADLKAALTNGYFLRLAGVKACQLLGVAASSAAMVFFIVN